MKKNTLIFILTTAIWMLISFVLYLIYLPTINLKMFSFWIFIFFILIGELTIISICRGIKNIKQSSIIFGVSVSVMFGILMFLLIASSPIFNAKKYQKQLGEIKEDSFVESISNLDNEGIPTVDIQLAYKQGEKTLGQVTGLGSQVNIGEFTLGQVDGKLMYVAPLEHSGFFKWLTNKTTPGYITVSATDPNDVKLVQEINGEKINLRYLESSFFADDLVRHVKLSNNISKPLTDYSFELDDNGRPYYVVTVYENEIFVSAPEVIGTVICDVQTGEITNYSIEDTPDWVDRIMPESIVNNQIQNWGEYIHGIFNFSNKDKLMKTDGMIIVYNEGNCYYYTGLTSVGADEAVVGFMMVNTRTKEAIKFTMGGATEQAAMMSASGLVQDMGYYSSIPIPINLNSVPTYFMTLKDNEGLIKSYALVNIENYSIAAVGSNIAEAKRNYMSKLSSSGNNNSLTDENSKGSLEGIVTRISANVENGNTSFYLVIDDNKEKLYIAPYNVSEELPITREGDKVKISYIDTTNGAISITSFDNLDYVTN